MIFNNENPRHGHGARKVVLRALVVALAIVATVCLGLQVSAHAEEAETISIYRVYNKWTGEHIFTTDMHEYDTLSEAGWTEEGIAWEAPQKTDSPVYRLYNPSSGDHLFTALYREYLYDSEVLGWEREGIAFYSADRGATPVYRLHNPFEERGTHHYTTDKAEYDALGEAGWTQEDIAWFALY